MRGDPARHVNAVDVLVVEHRSRLLDAGGVKGADESGLGQRLKDVVAEDLPLGLWEGNCDWDRAQSVTRANGKADPGNGSRT